MDFFLCKSELWSSKATELHTFFMYWKIFMAAVVPVGSASLLPLALQNSSAFSYDSFGSLMNQNSDPSTKMDDSW